LDRGKKKLALRLGCGKTPYPGRVLKVQCTRFKCTTIKQGCAFNAKPLNKVVHLMHKFNLIIVVVLIGAVKIYVAALEALRRRSGGAREKEKTG